MHRFFVKEQQIVDQQIHLINGDYNHIKHVLRLRVGDTILVSDGCKYVYECIIDTFEENMVIASVLGKTETYTELTSKITLFQALPKGDKMESIIQKGTELGVHEIIPVKTKRCVVKLDEKKAARKVIRWNAIAESAAKQSGRTLIPVVKTPMEFNHVMDCIKEYSVFLLPYESADDMLHTKEVLQSIKPGNNIAMLIGPEGGFEVEEIELARQKGAKIITLGNRILRTETAPIVLLSILLFLLETD